MFILTEMIHNGRTVAMETAFHGVVPEQLWEVVLLATLKS